MPGRSTHLLLLLLLPGGCDHGFHTEAFGTGIRGHKDGKVGRARFNAPCGMTVCGSGADACVTDGMVSGLYVADRDSNRVRAVSLSEGANGGLDYAFRGGRVSTVAGNGEAAHADGLAASASFNRPEDVALAYHHGGGPRPAGLFELLVADTGNHCLRGITAGHVTTLAGTCQPGFGDGPAGKARFSEPAGLAIDGAGKVYVADRGNHRIRVYFQFQVSTLAGTGVAGLRDGPVAQARFNRPTAVTIDSEGKLYVADQGNSRIRVIHAGQVSTLAGSSGNLDQPRGVAAYPGEAFVADSDNGLLRVISGGAAETHEEGEGFSLPWGVAAFRKKRGGDEILFVSDAGAHRVWLIETNHPNW